MQQVVVKLEHFAPGGQAVGTIKLPDGTDKRVFVWGGLPGEEVLVQITKKRAGIYEGIVETVLSKSDQRVEAKNKKAFLSTSPWQILDWGYELGQKASLTQQAFAQQHISIPLPEVVTDGVEYGYRNKMEFTWWWDKEAEKLELANYRRGTKGKIAVKGSALARDEINLVARRVRNLLNYYKVEARQLKTLLIRSSQDKKIVAQLYVVNEDFIKLTELDFQQLSLQGFEVIYSEPKSPASVITARQQSFGIMTLSDEILGNKFNYPAESFFQINLPVYELALREIESKLESTQPIVDMYSGVGTIGLSVSAGRRITLVEINETAVEEMRRNVSDLNIKNAFVVLSPAESANDYITSDCQLILDPPRAGLHSKVIDRILEVKPKKIIYLSCNPATQARDVALLNGAYDIQETKVFNFFPKTPHIESLAVLTLK